MQFVEDHPERTERNRLSGLVPGEEHVRNLAVDGSASYIARLHGLLKDACSIASTSSISSSEASGVIAMLMAVASGAPATRV